MKASETDSRQKANQTPSALCSIAWEVAGGDVDEEAGAVVEDLLEGGEDGADATETLGVADGRGLPLPLHPAVNVPISSTATSAGLRKATAATSRRSASGAELDSAHAQSVRATNVRNQA